MVIEVATFEIKPGEEDAFVAAYRGVRGEVAGTPGCLSVRLVRGVESPSRFVLLAEWESLDAHLVAFRGTERFTRWRAAIGTFFAAPPEVQHYTDAGAPAR